MNILMTILSILYIPLFVLLVIVLFVSLFVKETILKIKIIIFALGVILLFVVFFYHGDKSIYRTVRGMRIFVIDEVTQKPIPNIIVYYNIEKGQLLPWLCTTTFRVIEEKYEADKNGMCFIPRRGFWVIPLIQWISGDSIAVNLDVVDKIKKEMGDEAKGFWSYFDPTGFHNVQLYYNKNRNYKGKVIYFRKGAWRETDSLELIREEKVYSFEFQELSYNNDIVIVQLKRY